MAVSIGDGRYYKLFTGNSPPNRLLIEDINEPGLLSDEYVQGVVVKVFPVKNSARYGKLCKLVLKEDVEKAARHEPCATINVFLLGDVANEGESIREGDRMVLTEAIAECSPTNEHHFQLIVWREKSEVSVWVISKRGKVRANTAKGVDIVHRSSENGGEFEKGNDSEEEEHVIYRSCEYDFTQQSVDDEQSEKVGEKRKGKFRLGPRGVTPSLKRSLSNVVVLHDKVNDEHVAKTLQHEESYSDSASTCTNASADLNTANIALPSIAVEAGGQSMVMSQKAVPGGNGQSVSLCLQSTNGTPEQPLNVQCTRIELTPSGVSTRIWNSPGTCFQSGQIKDPFQFGAMPLRDPPQFMALDRERQSPATVGKSNLTASGEGANTAAKTAAKTAAFSSDRDAPEAIEGTAALNEDNTNASLDDLAEQRDREPYVISPEEEDRIFLRARNQGGDDLSTTSSVKSFMPSDYTPAASLLMCSKDDGRRSPLRQVLHPKLRLPPSLNSEAGPSQPSPSGNRSPVKAFAVRVRKKSSHATAEYTVPPGYTTLASLQPETTINVFGVVKLFKPAWKCRGTDMCSVLMLMDPTAAESGGLECVSFQSSVSRLPDVHKVGDIVRLHRIKINQYQGRLQAKSSHGFAAVVFDRDAGLPVTAEMARVSSSTFTLTQSDKDTVECLKKWCDDHPVLFPPSNFLTVSQINPDCYFDLVCQILGIALHRALDCVVLYVTDGTQPKHDLRICDGADYSLIEPLSHGSIQDSDVISVFLYGSHAEVARLLAKQDEYVILHNVHSQVLKAGGSVCSVFDVVKPYLELCLHRGMAFGRGLSFLSPDSQEVVQINRRKGL